MLPTRFPCYLLTCHTLAFANDAELVAIAHETLGIDL